MHERLEHTRAPVPTGSLIDVRYEDLIRDPLSAVSHIYQALQLGDFDVARPAVERYFAERKGYVASQHAVASPWSDAILTLETLLRYVTVTRSTMGLALSLWLRSEL